MQQCDCDTPEGCIAQQCKTEDWVSIGQVKHNGNAEVMHPPLVIGNAHHRLDIRKGGGTARLMQYFKINLTVKTV